MGDKNREGGNHDQIMTDLNQIAVKVMVLLSVLVAEVIVVWLLTGYQRGCGQSSVVIYIVHVCIQSLMTNQYSLNK